MKIQCLMAMLPVAFFPLVACHRPAAASCVKVEVSWKGADAESIADASLGAGPERDLTIAYDGHAVVYFDEALPEVIAALERNKGQVPRDMIIGAPQVIAGAIPEPPAQVEVKRLRMWIDRERVIEKGLHPYSVDTALEGLAAEATDENRAAWEAVKVSKPDGTQIPITTLGEIKVETVKRPFINRPEVVVR